MSDRALFDAVVVDLDRALLDGAEVRDYVVGPTTDEVRRQNEAARAELVRRGLDPGPPSGEIPPDAIRWVNTVTGRSWIQKATP